MSKETQLLHSDDLPTWVKPTLPNDSQVVLLVEEDNFDYGGKLSAAYRLDLDRILPNNTKQGTVYSIAATGEDGADISVSEESVVPAYVEAFEPFEVKRAIASSETSKARFIIISLNQNVDDAYVIQSSGFYTFPGGHNYDVGTTYYLSDSSPGGVVNTEPVSLVQPLFYVVDTQTILISIGQ